jgi:hypothetical protein
MTPPVFFKRPPWSILPGFPNRIVRDSFYRDVFFTGF